MIDIDEWTITSAALKAQGATPNPRLKTVMDSLVRHLHDFAREVQLTEAGPAQQHAVHQRRKGHPQPPAAG